MGTKYTKNQLVEAFETFRESNRVIKDIADIYNAEDLTVIETDGDVFVHAGDVQLTRLELTCETE